MILCRNIISKVPEEYRVDISTDLMSNIGEAVFVVFKYVSVRRKNFSYLGFVTYRRTSMCVCSSDSLS